MIDKEVFEAVIKAESILKSLCVIVVDLSRVYNSCNSSHGK